MRTIILISCALLCMGPSCAQTVVFYDTFQGFSLEPGWTWTGNYPGFAGGLDGWSIQKESPSMSTPPAYEPFGSYLFHPIPYDPNANYLIESTIQVGDPFNTLASAHAYLCWVDASAPSHVILLDVAHSGWDWSTGSASGGNMTPPVGNYTFGVMLCAAYCVECSSFFDQVTVIDQGITTSIGQAAASAFTFTMDPSGEFAQVTFAGGLLPQALDVLDAQGRLLRRSAVNGRRTLDLDIQGLPPGMHLLRTVGSSSYVERFVTF